MLSDLATRYDMNKMKNIQLDPQLQSSTVESEITTKVSCFDFKQQLLSNLRDDNIMNLKKIAISLPHLPCLTSLYIRLNKESLKLKN